MWRRLKRLGAGSTGGPGRAGLPVGKRTAVVSVGVCFVGRADVYVQPGAADPVLSPAKVLALARRHVPAAAAVSGVDESGGEARAYLVDDDVVVKTQRPHRLRPRTSLAKEAYLLDTLGSRLGAQIPRLFGYDKVDT